MRWVAERFGRVEPTRVDVHGPGCVVGDRLVKSGRCAVTFERGDRRVVVEADAESLAGMLAEAHTRVARVAEQQQRLEAMRAVGRRMDETLAAVRAAARRALGS